MSSTASRSPKNRALAETCQRVEELLGQSSAYRKVDEGLYVIKQGSSLVMISVLPWKRSHVVIRLTAQLVKGVTMEVPLALELLELNASMRFGAFAFVPKGNVVLLCHTLLDRDLADAQEFLDTLADFAIIADEYDDRIAARYGGSTMQDLLEEATMHHIREAYETKDFLA
ncbi:MAG: YbjN domain-containing protein [Myxococcales bacterium]|nr:YbjN domain-containing protein [Myxococcales bacterium]